MPKPENASPVPRLWPPGRRAWTCVLAVLLSGAHAAVWTAADTAETDSSAGACIGTVTAARPLVPANGNGLPLETELCITVHEVLAGPLPHALRALVPGGERAGLGVRVNGFAVPARGTTARFTFHTRPDGALGVSRWHAAATAAATGEAPTALPVAGPLAGDAPAIARFTAPDRGESIPCVADTSILPAHVSTNQALAALEQALAIWQQASSLAFHVEGLAHFDQAASTIPDTSGRVYVQFGDPYHCVPAGSIGVGGQVYRYEQFPSGGVGGRVRDFEYHRAVQGFVVLDHTRVDITNTTSLAYALAHELGHVVGLHHSSETNDEPDVQLRTSIMYYRAAAAGSQPQLNAYDTNTVQRVHPADNTPPYSYERVMDIVTHPQSVNVAGINTVHLRGYDRQGGQLTTTLTNVVADYGDFSIAGAWLSYAANGYYATGRIDPAGEEFYDQAYVRFGDGVNRSPPVRIRVVSMLADSKPGDASDGLPDDWMTTYFKHIESRAADLSRAGDDADGDGFSNLDEFRAGTDPTDRQSRISIQAVTAAAVHFPARPYDLYELLSAPAPAGPFTPYRNPVLPTKSNGELSLGTYPAERRYLRVGRVP